MGRSTSCLKIIACGKDSVDNDDLPASEGKGSSDKRGWSFRKRSARHRVLNNTAISETPSSGNKDSPESAAINFQTPSISTGLEKISSPQFTDEKPQLSTSLNSDVIETIVAIENESKADVNVEESVAIGGNVEESVAIAIQAAIRGFLAQRSLLKLKNVVKLQAAIRGHLVRRHAVGTLRCVQAIFKMQALVRARRARLSLERSYTEDKLDEKHGKDNRSSKSLEKEVSVTKPNVTYTSIEKLLSNKFACQLLESTPKTKPIQIKCDPSRPNSAWKWLERWMSVSSSDLVQSQKPDLSTEQKEQEQVENSSSQMETEIPSEVCELADSKSSIKEAEVSSESEENLITYDAENFDFQACRPTSSLLRDNLEQPQAENTDTFDAKGIQSEIDLHPNPTIFSSLGDNLEQPRAENIDTFNAKEIQSETVLVPNQTVQSDAKVQMEHNFLSGKPEMESEQPKRSMKRFASDQLETEGKKFVFGSRKVSNPAFISAQSKFEELSSSANSGRSISSSSQDVGVDSNIDTVSSGADSVMKTKELNLGENSAPHNSRVQVGGSECGTELSISSTLDSPDRSEVGAMEFDHEVKVPKEVACNPNSTKNLDVEANDASTILVSNLSNSVSVQPEKLDDVNVESVNSVVAVDSPQVEHKPERSASDLNIELESETGRQAYRSSPEASPRSHITVPESQGTPASQVSVKAKRSKTDKSGSNQKLRSLSGSAGKRSPSIPNHDSGARSSVEKLPKDQKVGKRRNSFGSVRPDHDHEQRDSSSNNSLPSYMQATESARAKAHANNSPRSSPDVQDKDIYIKKRHSLPGANGKQGSPRIQQSMSQAQQGAKGNGTNPPHERKWLR